MNRPVLLAALLLTASPALAGMPPEKYDRPYAGELVRMPVPYEAKSRNQAWALCTKLAKQNGRGMQAVAGYYSGKKDGHYLYGCAIGGVLEGKNRCTVVYSYDPTGNDKKMKSNIFRHEQGHCNGWPANHPNARP